MNHDHNNAFLVSENPPPYDKMVIVIIDGRDPFIARRYKALDRDWWDIVVVPTLIQYRPDHHWVNIPSIKTKPEEPKDAP